MSAVKRIRLIKIVSLKRITNYRSMQFIVINAYSLSSQQYCYREGCHEDFWETFTGQIQKVRCLSANNIELLLMSVLMYVTIPSAGWICSLVPPHDTSRGFRDTFSTEARGTEPDAHVKPTNQQKVKLCNCPPRWQGLIFRSVSSDVLMIAQTWWKCVKYTNVSVMSKTINQQVN